MLVDRQAPKSLREGTRKAMIPKSMGTNPHCFSLFSIGWLQKQTQLWEVPGWVGETKAPGFGQRIGLWRVKSSRKQICKVMNKLLWSLLHRWTSSMSCMHGSHPKHHSLWELNYGVDQCLDWLLGGACARQICLALQRLQSKITQHRKTQENLNLKRKS